MAAVYVEYGEAAVGGDVRGIRVRAGVSAFGFGGSNFHCVLEEGEQTETRGWIGMIRCCILPLVGGVGGQGLSAGVEGGLDVGMGWKKLRGGGGEDAGRVWRLRKEVKLVAAWPTEYLGHGTRFE